MNVGTGVHHSILKWIPHQEKWERDDNKWVSGIQWCSGLRIFYNNFRLTSATITSKIQLLVVELKIGSDPTTSAAWLQRRHAKDDPIVERCSIVTTQKACCWHPIPSAWSYVNVTFRCGQHEDTLSLVSHLRMLLLRKIEIAQVDLSGGLVVFFVSSFYDGFVQELMDSSSTIVISK